jgi:hypothetical protein
VDANLRGQDGDAADEEKIQTTTEDPDDHGGEGEQSPPAVRERR